MWNCQQVLLLNIKEGKGVQIAQNVFINPFIHLFFDQICGFDFTVYLFRHTCPAASCTEALTHHNG